MNEQWKNPSDLASDSTHLQDSPGVLLHPLWVLYFRLDTSTKTSNKSLIEKKPNMLYLEILIS